MGIMGEDGNDWPDMNMEPGSPSTVVPGAGEDPYSIGGSMDSPSSSTVVPGSGDDPYSLGGSSTPVSYTTDPTQSSVGGGNEFGATSNGENISSSGFRSEAASGDTSYTDSKSFRQTEIDSMNAIQTIDTKNDNGSPADSMSSPTFLNSGSKDPGSTKLTTSSDNSTSGERAKSGSQDGSLLGTLVNGVGNGITAIGRGAAAVLSGMGNGVGAYSGLGSLGLGFNAGLLGSAAFGGQFGDPDSLAQSAGWTAAGTNALRKYSSFIPLFTLSAISKSAQNSGSFNKQMLNKNIIASTKGDWGGHGANRVKTEFGSFDYFIDDVVISTIPTNSEETGNTNAFKITFKVIEPYSMGLFFLTMQNGANACGYENFREAPYVMMIEFAGWTDVNGKSGIDPSLNRYIPIKMIKSQMRVTHSGSIYDCTAIPYNELVFRKENTAVMRDVTLRGKSVKDLLGSGEGGLVKAFKSMFQGDVKSGLEKSTDQIDIHFPSQFFVKGNTGNDIASSDLYKNLSDNGTVPFPDMPKVFDVAKQIYKDNTVKIDKDKNMHFPQEMKIEDILTAVILRSDYIVKQIINPTLMTNPLGMMHWFRIESNVIDNAYNPQYGRQNRTRIYRVVPYDVAVDKFMPVNVQPPGLENQKKTVNRVYSYIYSGENTEVLNLDLQFNVAFFTDLPADGTASTSQNNANQGGLNEDKDPKKNIQAGNAPNKKELPGSVYPTSGSNQTDIKGHGSDSPVSKQAETMQKLLTNEGDMVKIALTIMGDPYYISSSGMGNQQKNPVGANMLEDGSMNYQGSEPQIGIVLRTPIDLNPVTGLYKFSTQVDQLSGLYKIIKVESKFMGGKFTQVIHAVRLQFQLSSSGRASSFFGFLGQ